MKVREHRGGLDASMATVAEIDPTFTALAEFFSQRHETSYQVEQLAAQPYGYDKRIDWDTHIVTIDGNAMGFTDQMPMHIREEQTDIDLAKTPEEIGTLYEQVMDLAAQGSNTARLSIPPSSSKLKKESIMATSTTSSTLLDSIYGDGLAKSLRTKFRELDIIEEQATPIGLLWNDGLNVDQFKERIAKLNRVRKNELLPLDTELDIRDALAVQSVHRREVILETFLTQRDEFISNPTDGYITLLGLGRVLASLSSDKGSGDNDVVFQYTYMGNRLEKRDSNLYYSGVVVSKVRAPKSADTMFVNVNKALADSGDDGVDKVELVEYFTLLIEESNQPIPEAKKGAPPYDAVYQVACVKAIQGWLSEVTDDLEGIVYKDMGHFLIPRDTNIAIVENQAGILFAMKEFYGI